MATTLDDTGTRGLWANIALPVAAVVIGNAIIFGLGAARSDLTPAQQQWVPPGAVVGSVWVVLFALLGMSRWLYLRGGGRGGRSWLPAWLALLGLAFPVYTGLFTDSGLGAAGTAVTLAATVAVMLAMGRRVPAAAWAILPMACWLGYVACVYFLA
ncbi:tryptophan-rich sensory protein [Sphingomonas canadensis]|uniref:Tryptophan-rich sensory protein n=1 Tax=Sphingomonas canadensis TaxID=1219257 RepID=A0ABW3H2F3_9SPHN|nr:tryptophan-rich sensory protein [Sphingomonas canadensis]MCW3835199.1 tryptophan-rich sensory protein [Sphingomonas canadensis]